MAFSNTTYRQTTDSLVAGLQSRLDNPYYTFTDKKPTVVTYWNINYKKSTLDQGSQQPYDQIGDDYPLRYNKVNNFVLYGLPRMNVNYNLGEYGIESPIEGEAYILPNTIIPCVEDWFTIGYVNEFATDPILFKVTHVTIDTLESGANFYKIEYTFDKTDKKYIEELNGKLLVYEYEYLPGNVGTNRVCLISKGDNDLINRLQSVYDLLKSYYIDLFYRRNIQTFVYCYDGLYIYDPYLIEFIIRNKILDSGEYMYITQAVHTPDTFAIEYDHTIFRDIEKQNPQLHLNSNYPVLVHDPMSLLVDRMEDYYELSINLKHKCYNEPINNIDMDLFDRIVNNKLYNEENIKEPIYRNMIISYVNGEYSINDKMIDNLEELNYKRSKDLFYEMPILMYCIEAYINNIQQDNSGKLGNNDLDTTEECYMTRK